jgi:hypothetical protein
VVESSSAPAGPAARTVPERDAPVYGPPESYRIRALLALGVALVGVGAFLVGLRHAVDRIPPDAEARAAVRRDSLLRVRGAGATARPGRGGGRAQPEELPRLR